MEIHEFHDKFRDSINSFQAVGEEYAEAKALSWYMTEMRKVILANEMSKHDGSEANKERQALCSEGYRIHLEGTREALKKENVLRARYEKIRYQIEAYRSLSSLEKAAMSMT